MSAEQLKISTSKATWPAALRGTLRSSIVPLAQVPRSIRDHAQGGATARAQTGHCEVQHPLLIRSLKTFTGRTFSNHFIGNKITFNYFMCARRHTYPAIISFDTGSQRFYTQNIYIIYIDAHNNSDVF